MSGSPRGPSRSLLISLFWTSKYFTFCLYKVLTYTCTRTVNLDRGGPDEKKNYGPN